MNVRNDDRKIKEREIQEVRAKEAGRLARNAYAREWRANNPEKVRQYNKDYWARKALRNIAM